MHDGAGVDNSMRRRAAMERRVLVLKKADRAKEFREGIVEERICLGERKVN
jgi:hypothetical protein